MYQPHPSAELNRLFHDRPFQGADPRTAKFIFVGLDANYSIDLENTSIFQDVIDYHADGVSFWRKHNVHHPFMLPSYKGDGRRYHLNFSRIGLTSQDASKISFIELLNKPTVGRNKIDVSDLDANHLKFINSLITTGISRHFFVSAGVLGVMRKTNQCNWLMSSNATGILPIIGKFKETKIHQHLHFSNYGKFQNQLNEEALAIRLMVKSHSQIENVAVNEKQ